MNPWMLIIAQYGLPMALELRKIIADGNEPTVADFQLLIEKYGTETLEQKLAKLYAGSIPKV